MGPGAGGCPWASYVLPSSPMIPSVLVPMGSSGRTSPGKRPAYPPLTVPLSGSLIFVRKCLIYRHNSPGLSVLHR